MEHRDNSLSPALEDSIRADVLARLPNTLQWRFGGNSDTRSQRSSSTATLAANPDKPARTSGAAATPIPETAAAQREVSQSKSSTRRDSARFVEPPATKEQENATISATAISENIDDLEDEVAGTAQPGQTSQRAETEAVEESQEGEETEDADDLREWTDVSEVERILDHGTNEDGTVSYFVRWKGYGEEENLWIGEEGVKELAKERYWSRLSASARTPRPRPPGKLDGFSLADLPAQGDDQAWQQWTPLKYRWKGGAIYETDGEAQQAWLDTQKHRLRAWQDKHSRD